MQSHGRLAGYRFLHRTNNPNVAILRIPSEGLLGFIGLAKKDYVVQKNCPPDEGVPQDYIVHLPLWAWKNGSMQEIEREIIRFRTGVDPYTLRPE